MHTVTERILKQKKERDAVILAHYYVNEDVQAIADYVGDSYYLSELAASIPNKMIVFCGVSFMGESAKILSPRKTVLMPDSKADCPMAHMADIEGINAVKARYEDVAIVCYINSTADIKANSDICVTSSNALKILRQLPNKNIYFIPDSNLGRYVAGELPGKNFMFSGGYCHVHTGITRESVLKAKALHKGAKVLAHPECTKDVLSEADYIGSTKGIIEHASSIEEDCIICTESGISYELRKRCPGKNFYFPKDGCICPDMKMITPEKVAVCLEELTGAVEVDDQKRLKAINALEKMLKLGR